MTEEMSGIAHARVQLGDALMPLSARFLSDVGSLYHEAMGTENAALLLYALVRFTRPRRLLEIGAGYTTVFILQALADNVESHKLELQRIRIDAGDRSNGSSTSLLRDYYSQPYEPQLVAIDDLSHGKTTATKVQSIANALQISQYLKFVIADYSEVIETLLEALVPLDFAWLDCGSYKNYVAFMQDIWPRMNGDGGLFILHSTETNFEAQAFIQKMKIKQATVDFANFELCGLLEPHKTRQNSMAIFRVTRELNDRFYSVRS